MRTPTPPDDERAFAFLKLNERQAKPRTRGLTEIRGPYYTPMGPNYLRDVLDTMGRYVDALKFAGGSFSLMPRWAVREMIELCHGYDVLVSTGGFIETVLTQGADAVRAYLSECAEIGFDVVEVSSGFLTMPPDDFLRLIERVRKAGLKAKAEVGVQFGAGGASPAEELAAEGVRDVEWAVSLARRCLDAGAYQIMLESEGVTENVAKWRTEVPARFAAALGLDNVTFEAADPEVFGWYVKNYGPEVNLFVDHSQVVQLECLRSGVWGDKSLWGRVLTYRGD
jgi:phosphosulfolactate synthase (CoM biosynthesis protein A)